MFTKKNYKNENEVKNMKVGVSERMKSSVREQALTMGRRIDLYLTENMPDMIDKYDLATKRDINDVEKQFNKYESTIDDLNSWRDKSEKRLSSATERVKRLETKYGLQQEVKK
jgi:hypothetical protein